MMENHLFYTTFYFSTPPSFSMHLIQLCILVTCIKHYIVKISDHNSSSNFVLGYGLIDPPRYMVTAEFGEEGRKKMIKMLFGVSC